MNFVDKNGVPELLVTESGKRIESVFEWENIRRGELIELLSRYEYGKRPEEDLSGIKYSVTDTVEYIQHGITKKTVTVSLRGFSFPFWLYTPSNCEEKLPCFVNLFPWGREKSFNFDVLDNYSMIPVVDICSRGYAVALVFVSRIYPDWQECGDFEKGVFSAYGCKKETHKNDDWAGLSAWAWGASRVLDYLETDPCIDSERSAVIGHSRCGKTALLCGALDERYMLTVSNSSGCGGAAMHRGKVEGGERIRDIIITDWFCGNYAEYADRDDELPVDQHMLLSLIAPRALYVQSSAEDTWADPDGEVRSCILAGDAYKLYGKQGLIIDGEIKIDMPYHEGSIAYHRRAGAHAITPFDWKLYMDYADKILKRKM